MGARLLTLLEDMDQLLWSDSHFLLGTWLEAAKQLANDAQERRLYEFNARNQITLWGPTGNVRLSVSSLATFNSVDQFEFQNCD